MEYIEYAIPVVIVLAVAGFVGYNLFFKKK